MAAFANASQQSANSSRDEGDAVSWEHIEDTGPKHVTLEMLSEAFASLNMESIFDDAHSASFEPSHDTARYPSEVSAPIIKVTPPDSHEKTGPVVAPTSEDEGVH